MNIFILDSNYIECAKLHNDTHVRKMLVESCQLLCSAHYSNPHNVRTDIPYKKTHMNHPCSKWVRESKQNYIWLCNLALELSNEFEYRFGKTHKSKEVAQWCSENVPSYLRNIGLTKFPIGFNRIKYKDLINDSNIVQTYQLFYKNHKQAMSNGRIYTWTKRNKPEFML